MLTEVINQIDVTHILRALHLNTKEHTFFISAPHGNYNKIDSIVGNKETLTNNEEIERISTILSKHHR